MLNQLITFQKHLKLLKIPANRKFSKIQQNKRVELVAPVTKIITNKEEIDRDYGLKQFMNKTYMYTASGVLSTMGSGMLLSHFPNMFEYSLLMMGGGFITSMVGCVAFDKTKYKIHTTYLTDQKTNKVIEAYHSENTLERKISYASIIGGMSLMSSPLIAFANMGEILAPAMLSTSLVFGGAMYYAKTRKVGELEPLGSALYGGLVGLIGCSLTGIGSTLLFGPNTFSVFMHSIDLYAGIPLFAGFVAYDTHVTIDMYRKKNPDHLGCSLQLYLDFTNLLIRMIEIMSIFHKKN